MSILLALFILVSNPLQQPVNWWNLPEVQRCCSEADALYADDWEFLPDGSVRATVTGGGPRNHAWAPIGREYVIPPHKILTIPGNPTGRPILFISPYVHERVFCFAPGPMI